MTIVAISAAFIAGVCLTGLICSVTTSKATEKAYEAGRLAGFRIADAIWNNDPFTPAETNRLSDELNKEIK